MSHRKSDLGIPCPRKTAKVVLGRGLINAQPQPYGCKLDECGVVGSELVVAGCHTPTVLDLVEEPLDQVASAVEIRAEADRLATIAPWWNVGPSVERWLACLLMARQQPP